ncbi:MAG: transposase, partial [Nitrososphaera sp.]
NGVADHAHLFFGLKPSMAISDLIRDVKNNTSNFINEQNWVKGRFVWQEGYGAFSHGHSQIKRVYNYILHQEEHHRKRTFREEYLEFLEKFQVPYEDCFLFEWLD